MAPRLELPITNAVARQMTVVAAAAADEPGSPSRAERNAVRTVGRRLIDGASPDGTAALFGGGDPDERFTALSISSSTLRTYLKALDDLATGTATPHRRQACRTVFVHLTDSIDVDALGLRLANYETLEPKRESTVFS